MAKFRRKNDPNVLRDHLDGGQILTKVFEIIGWLQSGWIPEYNRPTGPVTALKPEDFQVIDWVEVRPQDVSRLKASLDFYMKLLAKIMPDLKSIEISDATPQEDRISPQERATRLLQVLSQLPEGQKFAQERLGIPQPPAPKWH